MNEKKNPQTARLPWKKIVELLVVILTSVLTTFGTQACVLSTSA